MTTRRCYHQVLEIEEYTDLGAHCRCVLCDTTFHVYQDDLIGLYLPFHYVSGREGPDGDRELAVKKELFL